LTPSADKIRIAPPDTAIASLCASPAPVAGLTTQGQQAAAWRRDRINLRVCADRQAALVGWAAGVVEAVSGQ